MEKTEARAKRQLLESTCCTSLASSATTISDGGAGGVGNQGAGGVAHLGDGHNNNNEQAKSLARANGVTKKSPVSIRFENITYTVKTWSFKKFLERKEILRGVSGEFRSGKLSAIMGPSGAGKSTLLNVLAGYVTTGVGGQVLVNERTQDRVAFSKMSCYIQQDDRLRAFLSAHELMVSTSHLKLGSSRSQQAKEEQVTEILAVLGLEDCRHTRCSALSGGQQKRLSIALELISNPPVLFLDEPTTGLDSSSCSQCVALLKMLAMQGRTIVCTIHQPSALLFEMFDHLHALSAGQSIYQGPPKALTPYLEKFGLQCPSYHNPADFLMDVCLGEYGADPELLADEARILFTPPSSKNVEVKRNAGEEKMSRVDDEFPEARCYQDVPSPASSLPAQFWLLLCRNMLSMARDKSRLLLRLGVHVVIGLIFGYLYRGVGDNALLVLGNCVFIYGTLLFLVYTGKMAVTLSFPLEYEMLRREHFNRWYSLGPYFLSLISIEIPVQVMCVSLYLSVAYPLTSQPMEWARFLQIYFLCLTASLTAQAFGFLIGITTPVKIAVFIGPVVAVVLSMFGFNIFYRDIPAVFRWLFHLSYFRAAYQGALFSAYGGRAALPCPEGVLYCHFKSTAKFLQDMDSANVGVAENMSFIVGWGLCLYVLTFLFAQRCYAQRSFAQRWYAQRSDELKIL